MSNKQHTPGPWHTRSHGNEEGAYIPIYNEDGLWIAEAMGRGGLKNSKVGPDDNQEIRANANLIAAAPELFSMLERLERLHRDGFDIQSSVFHEIKSLVAKAKGETI